MGSYLMSPSCPVYAGYPPQGYPPQGYQPQGYPPQGYPPEGYQQQGYPPQQQMYQQQPQYQQQQQNNDRGPSFAEGWWVIHCSIWLDDSGHWRRCMSGLLVFYLTESFLHSHVQSCSSLLLLPVRLPLLDQHPDEGFRFPFFDIKSQSHWCLQATYTLLLIGSNNLYQACRLCRLKEKTKGWLDAD